MISKSNSKTSSLCRQQIQAKMPICSSQRVSVWKL
jgi:hypothetical protein